MREHNIGTVIRAETWRGPYTVVARGACGAGEDMYMYRDTRGHFHCIWHNTASWAGAHQEGGHSFSVDGGDPWYCVDGKGSHGDAAHGFCGPGTPVPYNTTLWHYSNHDSAASSNPNPTATGTAMVMGTRERPHLLFADDGSPLALVTATRYCNGSIPLCASDVPPGYSDRSFTSVAALRTAQHA